MKKIGTFLSCSLVLVIFLSLFGCFEDKVKVEMASYYTIFSPKFKSMKDSVPKEPRADNASIAASSKNITNTLQSFSKELQSIKPKTPEVQEVHAKICSLISSATGLAEVASQMPPEPDAASMARIAKIQAAGDKTAKEIESLLRKIASEHTSDEALRLLNELDLHPGK